MYVTNIFQICLYLLSFNIVQVIFILLGEAAKMDKKISFPELSGKIVVVENKETGELYFFLLMK